MNVADDSRPHNSVTADIASLPPRDPAGGATNADKARPAIKGVSRSMLESLAARAPVKPVRTTSQKLMNAPRTSRSADVLDRARAYLATKDPAISGSGGHSRAFAAVRDLVWGFDLSPEQALPLLAEWNQRCDPPWSDSELAHKIQQADTTPYSKPRGHLLNARSAAKDNPTSTSGATPKPLRNYIWEEVSDGETMRRVKRGRSVKDVAEDLLSRTSGWPKRCGPRLFIVDEQGQPDYLRLTPDLFAWLNMTIDAGNGSPVDWVAGSDVVGKEEFRAGLMQVVERYEQVELYPHHPPLATHYYCHPKPSGGSGVALEDLLARLRPATEQDAYLIRALLLTLVWGGPPGSRPAFLISAREDAHGGGRASGKTKLAQKLANIVGGAIEVKSQQDFPKWCDSYVSGRFAGGASAGQRVLLLDNLKSLRFSSADMEALVTGQSIGGHLLYHGIAQVPNTLTLVITGNAPNLSKDMAQRVIPIQVEPATFDPGWEADIDSFIEVNRWAIIGDLIAELQAVPAHLTDCLRWATWCGQVLARCPDPNPLVKLIRSRQATIDADEDAAEQVRDAIVKAVVKERGHIDPETTSVRITSNRMAAICGGLVSESKSSSVVTRVLRSSYQIRGLRYYRANDSRGWLWSGDLCDRNAEPWELEDVTG